MKLKDIEKINGINLVHNVYNDKQIDLTNYHNKGRDLYKFIYNRKNFLPEIQVAGSITNFRNSLKIKNLKKVNVSFKKLFKNRKMNSFIQKRAKFLVAFKKHKYKQKFDINYDSSYRKLILGSPFRAKYFYKNSSFGYTRISKINREKYLNLLIKKRLKFKKFVKFKLENEHFLFKKYLLEIKKILKINKILKKYPLYTYKVFKLKTLKNRNFFKNKLKKQSLFLNKILVKNIKRLKRKKKLNRNDIVLAKKSILLLRKSFKSKVQNSELRRKQIFIKLSLHVNRAKSLSIEGQNAPYLATKIRENFGKRITKKFSDFLKDNQVLKLKKNSYLLSRSKFSSSKKIMLQGAKLGRGFFNYGPILNYNFLRNFELNSKKKNSFLNLAQFLYLSNKHFQSQYIPLSIKPSLFYKLCKKRIKVPVYSDYTSHFFRTAKYKKRLLTLKKKYAFVSRNRAFQFMKDKPKLYINTKYFRDREEMVFNSTYNFNKLLKGIFSIEKSEQILKRNNFNLKKIISIFNSRLKAYKSNLKKRLNLSKVEDEIIFKNKVKKFIKVRNRLIKNLMFEFVNYKRNSDLKQTKLKSKLLLFKTKIFSLRSISLKNTTLLKKNSFKTYKKGNLDSNQLEFFKPRTKQFQRMLRKYLNKFKINSAQNLKKKLIVSSKSQQKKPYSKNERIVSLVNLIKYPSSIIEPILNTKGINKNTKLDQNYSKGNKDFKLNYKQNKTNIYNKGEKYPTKTFSKFNPDFNKGHKKHNLNSKKAQTNKFNKNYKNNIRFQNSQFSQNSIKSTKLIQDKEPNKKFNLNPKFVSKKELSNDFDKTSDKGKQSAQNKIFSKQKKNTQVSQEIKLPKTNNKVMITDKNNKNNKNNKGLKKN